MDTTATWTKLRTGDWGVRVVLNGENIGDGDAITVTKRNGETKTAILGRRVWAGVDGTDRIAVFAVAKAGSAPPVNRGGRGTWTGCSCGSVDEYEKPSDCWTCRHDR
ncbi:MAG: hypothetical protein ABIL09_29850 [Gemmatimonadota bacterium]